ncbi:AAA domain-containing protein [Spiroplasma endosymbiont of Cantharis rufa]|uniref:AAA domain-containing protein n=1 Tax=Spiroplasma endosymbiont of Cantharis rufa TaxID=3066279 RepID=UPI0030D1DBC1
MSREEKIFNYWIKLLNDLFSLDQKQIEKENLLNSSKIKNQLAVTKNDNNSVYSSIRYFFNKHFQNNYKNLNKESVLYYYINSSYKNWDNIKNRNFIYPFGINNSQKKAVENAFKSNFSIIQGPPGTGKSQTILNIVSNILLDKKTVAIVSNNNSAIDNIFYKLNPKIKDSNNYEEQLEVIWFLSSFLGSFSKNKNYFTLEMQQKIVSAKEKWKKAFENSNVNMEISVQNSKFQLLIEEIEEIEILKKKILRDEKVLPKVKKEKEIYESKIILKYKDNTNLLKLSLDKLNKFYINIKVYKKDKLSWWFKLKNKFKYKLPKNFFKYDFISEIYFHVLNKKAQELKENLIKNKKLLNEIDNNQLDDLIKISKEILYNSIYENYMSEEKINLTANNFTEVSYEFVKLLNKQPIVLSTIFSLINSKPADVLYDYLIIDEASQTDMLASIASMACAKKIIVVGDLKQLSQVNSPNYKNYFEENKLFLNEGYEYWENNILKSLIKIYGEKIPNQLLREHYRCDPAIIEFCNQKYYNNELIIMTESENEQSPFELIVGESLYYTDTNNSKTSRKEFENIKQYLNDNKISDIGIISPFRDQANILNKQLGTDKIIANTIHAFQGQEKDSILFAVTRQSIKGKDDFVSNPKLINVAVSRAKNKFILAYSKNINSCPDNDIKDLINYIQFNFPNSKEVYKKNTEFYILSKEYNNDLIEFIKNYNKNHFNGAKEPTEIIVHTVLEKIISLEEFNNLDITLFKKLSHIIPKAIEKDIFNKREKEFLNHHWSHIDFLVYDKFNFEPVLAIEVDGYTFHRKEKQKWRDNLKDKALKIQNIPIMRISTDTYKKIGLSIINKIREIKNK